MPLADGRYRVFVSGGRDPRTGKRIRLTAYAANEDEAHIRKAEFLDKRSAPRGLVLADRRITVRQWCETWIKRVRDNERTHHFRLDKLRPVLDHLGHLPLHALDQDHVRDLINGTLLGEPYNYAPLTRKHVRDVLRAMLNAAMIDPKVKLGSNACHGIKVHGYRDDNFDPRILNEREYEDFLSAAARYDKQLVRGEAGTYVQMEAFWVIQCERGLREGETLGLRWQDIDLGAATMHVHTQAQRRRGGGSTKGQPALRGKNLELVRLKTKNSARRLRLTPRTIAALRRHRTVQDDLRRRRGPAWNPLDLVFPTITGLPMQGSVLTHDYFRPVCRLAGITYSDTGHKGGLRIQDLRHTFATRHLRQHKNLVLTQMVLGHSSTKMTERYVHLLAVDENIESTVQDLEAAAVPQG